MYFDHCKTLNELKAEYKRLCLLNHPDMGGETRTMQDINAEHDRMFERLKAAHNEAAAACTDGSVKPTTEAPEEFRAIIELLLSLDGLTVELCGCWLWIGGNTREHKDALKAAGCRWCKSKQLWSWHHAEDGSRWYRGRRSMDDIRDAYGSQTFATRGGGLRKTA